MNGTRGLRMASGLVATCVLLCTPSRAAAHLVTTGMGPVYDGIGHLLLTPEDLVPVFAIALYAGLRGVVPGRRTMFLLPLSWFIGGLAGSVMSITILFPLPVVSFLILGGLIAMDYRMSVNAISCLAIALGFVHGFMNGAVLRDGAGVVGLIGIISLLFILVTLVSALVVSQKKNWVRIAVRVVGSWIASTGMLILGWSMR